MSLIQKISTNFRIIIQKNGVIFWISEYFHYLCRRLAALGNLKASFHCTHWHRFFPLKKAFFYLSVSPARKDFFRKPTRPSLPLRKAPPLISVFSPQARRRKPPYSVLFFRFPPSPFSQRELHLQPSLPPQKEGCKPPYSVLGTAAL